MIELNIKSSTVKKTLPYILLSFCFGCKALDNAKNIRSLSKGMTIAEVDIIMGKPMNVYTETYPDDTIRYPYDERRFFFEYESGTGMSSEYRVYFNIKDSLVSDIGYGE